MTLQTSAIIRGDEQGALAEETPLRRLRKPTGCVQSSRSLSPDEPGPHRQKGRGTRDPRPAHGTGPQRHCYHTSCSLPTSAEPLASIKTTYSSRSGQATGQGSGP